MILRSYNFGDLMKPAVRRSAAGTKPRSEPAKLSEWPPRERSAWDGWPPSEPDTRSRRELVVSHALVEEFRGIDPAWPEEVVLQDGGGYWQAVLAKDPASVPSW